MIKKSTMDMAEAESRISGALSKLPDAPYTVQIKPFSTVDGYERSYQIHMISTSGLNSVREAQWLNLDTCDDAVFMVKAFLYEQKPADPVIDLTALNKEIGDLKAKVERQEVKLKDGRRDMSLLQHQLAFANAKLHGAMLTLQAEFRPGTPDTD